MGRVNKGINCSIKGCTEQAERSIVRAKEKWLSTWIFPQLVKESIYVETIIKNEKLQKKIEKRKEARWK